MGTPRSLLFGLAAGALLALGSMPLGSDWVRVVGIDGPTAARGQAAAWLLLGGALAFAARRGVVLRPTWLLVGAVLGSLGALWLAAWLGRPASAAGTWLALGGLTALLALLAGTNKPASSEAQGASDPTALGRPTGRVTLGWVLGGAGATLAVAALLRPLAHLWGGGPPDALAAVAGLGVGVLLGAWVLGGPLARHGAAAAALAPVATALGAIFGWTFLTRLAAPGGAADYLAAFGLVAEQHPLGLWGLLIATAALGAAGIAAGAGLAAVRSAAAWSALALGAALGILALAYLRDGWARPMEWEQALREGRAHLLPVLGVALAALGGTLASSAAPLEQRRATYWIALLGLFAGPALRPAPLYPLSPFEARSADVEVLLESADGLFTVERPPGGGRVATWDRRLLTPLGAELEADLERLASALRAVELFGLRPSTPRVLFVGLLTPERSAVLSTRAGMRLERTAPFWPYDAALERALFPPGMRPPGERIAPRDARRRLAEGAYDLVIATAPGGRMLVTGSDGAPRMTPPPAPRLGGLDLPLGSAGVLWIDARAALGARALGERVLLAARGAGAPHLAVLRGEAARWPRETPAGTRAALLAGTGTTWPRPFAPGCTPEEAGRAAALALAARLARAGGGEVFQESLAVGWGHLLAREPSLAVAPLAAAARAREGDPLAAALLEGAAEAAARAGAFEAVLTEALPLAEERGPWPELERAVAVALVAAGRGEEALERLVAMLGRRRVDPESWLVRAEVELGLGFGEEARASAGRALEMGLLRPALRRRAAVALAAAGEPVRARALARELLLELPGDPALEALLDGGRTPPPR
jgi:hypothetical protein